MAFLRAATTNFAPAGRDAHAEICRQTAVIQAGPMLSQTIDAMPHMVMILNGNRQIVAVNKKVLEVLRTTAAEIAEKRPGEAIKCIHAADGPDGCGTGLHCMTCGAVNAVLDSVKNNGRAVRECRVLVQTPAVGAVPLDLRVTATPFQVNGDKFVLAAIEDISHEKRLAVLQRTLFDEILNTAGCILGYVDYLAADASFGREVNDRLSALFGQLIDEIQSQRDLLSAESGEMEMRPMPINAHQILGGAPQPLSESPGGRGSGNRRRPGLGGDDPGRPPDSLSRSGQHVEERPGGPSPGGVVTIASFDAGDAVAFTVHNPEVMPQEVRLQVFQRSFSTKGEAGRGIGAYSMKLFGERCSRRRGRFHKPSAGRDDVPPQTAEAAADCAVIAADASRNVAARAARERCH